MTLERQSLTSPLDRRVAFFALQLAAFLILLWMGRRLTFIGDEWSFISNRYEWTTDAFFLPHNEHCSIGLALIYKTLLSTVGLRSYIPYLMVLLLLHVGGAGALYRYGRAQVGPAFGLAIAIVFLFLGSAGEDLFWAFQIGFVGATAFGAWALVLLLEGEGATHRLTIATLLLVAVLTAGIGLFFLASAFVAVVCLPNGRRNVRLLLPACGAYALWYLLFGSSAVRGPLARGPDLLTYAMLGVSASAGSLTGLGIRTGRALILLLSILALNELLPARFRQGRSQRLGLVCGLVGLATQFLLTGAVRAQFGAEQATSSRYIYSASAFILIALASWLGALRPFSLPVRGAGLCLWTLSLLSNLADLDRLRGEFVARLQLTRAAVSILLQFGGGPGVPASLGMAIRASEGYLVPASGEFGATIPNSLKLREIVARAGAPTQDFLVPRLAVVPAAALDTMLFRIVAESFTLTSVRGIPESTNAPDLWPQPEDHEIKVTFRDGCLVAQSSRKQARIFVTMAPGSRLFARSSTSGSARVFLSRWGAFSEGASKTTVTGAGSVIRIELPDFDAASPWIVRIDPPSPGETYLCSVRPAVPGVVGRRESPAPIAAIADH